MRKWYTAAIGGIGTVEFQADEADGQAERVRLANKYQSPVILLRGRWGERRKTMTWQELINERNRQRATPQQAPQPAATDRDPRNPGE